MIRLIEPSQADKQPMVKLVQPVDTKFRTIDDMVRQLQLHAIATPATANCMVVAIVQALCDADLATQDNQLKAATDSLKRGIKYSGQLHLGEQFPHEHRVATLIAVQRGWAGMEPLASKWYLEEFGKSTSERNARVHIHNWGGCDTLCMAAKFLRRNIYVIAKGGDGGND